MKREGKDEAEGGEDYEQISSLCKDILHTLSNLASQVPCKVSSTIIPILERRKVRP
jgi:hypothetical protein